MLWVTIIEFVENLNLKLRCTKSQSMYYLRNNFHSSKFALNFDSYTVFNFWYNLFFHNFVSNKFGWMQHWLIFYTKKSKLPLSMKMIINKILFEKFWLYDSILLPLSTIQAILEFRMIIIFTTPRHFVWCNLFYQSIFFKSSSTCFFQFASVVLFLYPPLIKAFIITVSSFFKAWPYHRILQFRKKLRKIFILMNFSW